MVTCPDLTCRGPGPGLDSGGRGGGNCWATEPEHWALRHGRVCTGVCWGPETQTAHEGHHSGGWHCGQGPPSLWAPQYPWRPCPPVGTSETSQVWLQMP